MTEELKLCPFCGAFAGMTKAYMTYYGHCQNDSCYVRGRRMATKDEAILAWNTRVDDFSDWPDAPPIYEVNTQMDCEFDLGDDRAASISLPHDLTEDEARDLLVQIGEYMENWFMGG